MENHQRTRVLMVARFGSRPQGATMRELARAKGVSERAA